MALKHSRTMKTGLNDVSGIIWALVSFFILNCVFLYTLIFYCIFKLLSAKQETERVVTTKIGPNNARHII